MIALREASVSDLELLKFWDSKPHVIDCDPDDDWNWKVELIRSPDWREQLMAELDGGPMGFIQIIAPHLEETHYWGDVDRNKRAFDIWKGEEEHLNKGYGTTMMELAVKRCFQTKEVEGVLVHPLKSNTKAHNLYERLGFEFVKEKNLPIPFVLYTN